MIGIEEQNGFQRVDGTPVPDTALSTTSTNSVQNKVVTENINQINTELSSKVTSSSLVESTSSSHNITFKWTTTPASYIEIYVDNTKVAQIKGFKKYD